MNKLIKFLKAFSVIELMISLVAISVITASFAPVISKKIQSNEIVAGSILGGGGGGNGGLTLDCEDNFSSDCVFCDSARCYICSKTCDANTQYQDIYKCVCKNCTTVDAQCTKCDFNKTTETGKCTKCNTNGYYVNSSEKCSQCPKGNKCTDGINRTSCDSGYYQDAIGQTTCKACNTNCYECAKDTGYCTKCKAGTGKSGNYCATCGAGYIQGSNIAINSANCTICTGTTYANDAHTACSNCEAGYACSNGIRSQCTGTTYATANSGSCSTCSHCTACNNTNGQCTKCATGYKLASNNCNSACSASEHCPNNNTGAVACSTGIPGCSSCGSGVCSTCSSSYYKNSINTCSACSSGGTGMAACMTCSSSSVCTKCSAGYHLTSANKCEQCNANQYCPENTGTSPSACSTGITGCASCSGATCTTCSTGYYKNSINKCSKCDSSCYTCSSNTSSSCTSCYAGKYLSSSRCYSCAAGSTSNNGNTTSSCSYCPAGQWSDSGGGCYSCGAGYACPGNGTATACAAGKYSTGGAASCTNCPAGQWSAGTASSCYSCPAGYACYGNGTSGQCTGATYSTGGASSCSTCSNCSACNNSTGACSSCNAGYKLSGTSCVACGSSEYCPGGTTGATSCSSHWAHCSTCNSSACTACETNYNWNGSACELAILTTSFNGKTWTTRNAGDTGGPIIPADVSMITSSGPLSSCNVTSTNKGCCTRLYSTTSGTTTCTAGSQGYSGCRRTVCSYRAAKYICESNGMRLPTKQDVWTNGDPGNAVNLAYIRALALCTNTEANSLAVCPYAYFNAINSQIRPYIVVLESNPLTRWADGDCGVGAGGYMVCSGFVRYAGYNWVIENGQDNTLYQLALVDYYVINNAVFTMHTMNYAWNGEGQPWVETDDTRQDQLYSVRCVSP